MNNAAKTNRYLPLFLGGICLMLVLLIIVDMDRNYALTAVGEPGSQNTHGNRQTTIETEGVTVKSLDEYEQIIERPLFMQDRRPYVEDQLVGAAQRNRRNSAVASAAQDEYMLSAVIITDEKRIALLHSKRNSKLHKLNQGDELDGWTITDIQPAQVSLRKGSEKKQLELVVKGSPQQAGSRPKKETTTAEAIETPVPIELSDKNTDSSKVAPDVDDEIDD